MSVDQHLAMLFPQYEAPARAIVWDALKQKLPLGMLVSGRVVHREPFGVFIDIGVGFPVLLLVVRFKNSDTVPHTNMNMYPAMDAVIDGRICILNDDTRQISITQQARESWMEGTW